MTKDAQFALRRIIEKYTKHTRFCLIGNHVSKVIPALQSRCTRFRFAPLAPESVRERIAHVVQCESLAITAEGVDAVRDLGAGDMRRTLNILQSSFLLPARAPWRRTTCTPPPASRARGTSRPSPACCSTCRSQRLWSGERHENGAGLALGDICKLLCEYVFRLHMPPRRAPTWSRISPTWSTGWRTSRANACSSSRWWGRSSKRRRRSSRRPSDKKSEETDCQSRDGPLPSRVFVIRRYDAETSGRRRGSSSASRGAPGGVVYMPT